MIKEIYNYIFNKSATLLNRHQLGSIDLTDVRDKKLTENEIRERNAAITVAYKHIENAIKRLEVAQEEYLSTHCEQTKPVLFGRGSINGISLVLEEFEDYKQQHDELIKPTEGFNKHKVI